MGIKQIKIGDTVHNILPLYGTCSTAADTVAKVVSLDSFVLETGSRITVKFTYANTVASPTLNVDGTGAKAIYWHGAALPKKQYWAAGAVLDFVYNGTQWELIGIADISTLEGLVGDTAVATQISNAIDAIPQADWNENDSSQPSFILNRPFYEEPPVETVLVDNATIELVDMNGDGSIGIAENPFTMEIAEGAEYTVTWNGDVYTATGCVDADGVPYVGNYAIATDMNDTGEPFLLIDLSAFGRGFGVYSTIVGAVTINVSAMIANIHTIDLKYLPSSVKIGSSGEGIGSEIFNDYEYNTATGENSHAEGYSTTASGGNSHAEGYGTTASGDISHAEGGNTTASGQNSHAEGYLTTASGDISHAEGGNTIAAGWHQHVQGKYNVEDADNKYAHIVGNGKSNTKRSNAHTLDWFGNAWFAGDVTVGADAKKLATEDHTHSLSKSAVTTALGYTPPTSDTNTTYTVATGDSNGQIKVTPSSGDAYNVAVKGLAAAAYKAVADSTSASAISTGTSLVTERDVYYGLPKINNSNSYTRSTTIYAPTAGGTSKYFLCGAGTTKAPTWASPATARTNLGFTYSDSVPTTAPSTGAGSVHFIPQADAPTPIAKGGTSATSVEEMRQKFGFGHVGQGCCAKNNIASVSLGASEMKAIPLNSWVSRTSEDFTFNGNGELVCPYSGIVLITASAYINGNGNRGAYVFKNDTEIMGIYVAAVANPGSIVISVAAGDRIAYKMRSSVAAMGYPTNSMSQLSLVYIN